MSEISIAIRRRPNSSELDVYFNNWWLKKLIKASHIDKLEQIIKTLKEHIVLILRLPEFDGKTIYCYKRSQNAYAILISEGIFQNSKDAKGLLLNLLEPHLKIKEVVSNPNKYKRTALSKVQESLDNTKEVMINNLKQMTERGEKLESILGKTEELAEVSALFKETAGQLNEGWCAYLLCRKKQFNWLYTTQTAAISSSPPPSPPIMVNKDSPIFIPLRNKDKNPTTLSRAQKDKASSWYSVCLNYPIATVSLLAILAVGLALSLYFLIPNAVTLNVIATPVFGLY